MPTAQISIQIKRFYCSPISIFTKYITITYGGVRVVTTNLNTSLPALAILADSLAEMSAGREVVLASNVVSVGYRITTWLFSQSNSGRKLAAFLT